jgi:hypothetical protein
MDEYEKKHRRYNRRIEILRAGHIKKVTPDMMTTSRVNNMVDRVNAQHRKDFCVNETVFLEKRDSPPVVNKQTMTSISDILSELAGETLMEEYTFKHNWQIDD